MRGSSLGKPLTITETLKFTRHDFLNDLQIILMNIDLGKPKEAREFVLKTTEKLKQESGLFSLGLPQTEVWLATFDYSHTAFAKVLNSQVKSAITQVDDDDLVLSLQTIIEKTEREMDVFSIYTAYVDVISTKDEWLIILKVTGNLPEAANRLHEKETFLVEEQFEENLWTFTIRGR